MLGILPASVFGGLTVSGAWRARSGFVGPRISPPLSPRLGSGLGVSSLSDDVAYMSPPRWLKCRLDLHIPVLGSQLHPLQVIQLLLRPALL